MKTELTKEQSQHLIDLGVPKEKASFQVLFEEDGPFDIWNEEILSRPIFALTDLLGILPKEINSKCLNQYNEEITERLFFCIDYFGNKYSVGYRERVSEFRMHIKKNATELIDSLYELCVWTIENKYL